MMKQKIQKL